jgi:ribonuclease I
MREKSFLDLVLGILQTLVKRYVSVSGGTRVRRTRRARRRSRSHQFVTARGSVRVVSWIPPCSPGCCAGQRDHDGMGGKRVHHNPGPTRSGTPCMVSGVWPTGPRRQRAQMKEAHWKGVPTCRRKDSAANVRVGW